MILETWKSMSAPLCRCAAVPPCRQSRGRPAPPVSTSLHPGARLCSGGARGRFRLRPDCMVRRVPAVSAGIFPDNAGRWNSDPVATKPRKHPADNDQSAQTSYGPVACWGGLLIVTGVVNHNAEIRVDGIYHGNTIENFWSLMKRSIGGAEYSRFGQESI